MPITFSNIAIDEPTTQDKFAATIQLDRAGQLQEQEIVVLGDPESTGAIGRVVAVAPDSTHYGAVVRQVGYVAPSTTAQVSSVGGAVIVRSSAADALVTASQGGTWTLSSLAGRVETGEYSSAAPAANSTGLIVRQVGYSTTIQVSSVGGAVIVRSSAADFNATITGTVRSTNSVIGDFLASVQQNSTVWQTQSALRISQTLQSTAFSTMGNNSTSSTIVSSVAGQRQKVYAYSITSTAQAVNTLSFASSLANPIWHIQMQSISSGISGANLAVSPPAYLFATAVAEPLVFKITGSTGSYHLSFSYFSEA